NGSGEVAAAAAPRERKRRERPDRGERGERGEREREAPLPEGHVRLYLNLGRRDGAKEPEVEQLLRDRSLEVQSLQVRNSHTYLIVTDERADGIIAGLCGGKFGERDLVCERARK